jgi:predicted Zn-dependent protease
LALAIGCAVLLNVLLLATWVWGQWLSAWQLRLGWTILALVWAASAASLVWRGRDEPTPPQPASAEGLFRQALNEYLQGNWFEAETLLGQLLQVHPRDAEARLLLATLLRRTGRPREALEQLARLELLRDSEKWALEIAAERQLLGEAMENDVPPAAELENQEHETAVENVTQRAA